MASDDIEWVVKALIACIFAIGMGILAAFFWGYLAIRMIMEVIFGH